jgi:hypothetical protein
MAAEAESGCAECGCAECGCALEAAAAAAVFLWWGTAYPSYSRFQLRCSI